MSWTVDFGAWPQKWEELPEQIAVTNKETGEWDFYMLTSRAMRMIRDAKDDANWLNAELHGAEMEAKKTVERKAENERLRSCLSDTEEHATMFLWETKQLEEERDKLRELVRDMWDGMCERCGCRGCEHYELYEGQRFVGECEYHRRMCELGIEVDG